MTLPTRSDGYTITENDWNPLVEATNTNTDDISANASDISAHSSRLDTLEAAYTSYDHALYGDKLSSVSRREATSTETTTASDDAGEGYLTAFGLIVPHTVTVSELRMYLTGAAASTDADSGTFDIGVYRGPSLSDMAQVGSDFGASLVTSTGMLMITFSEITIQAGEAVGVEMVATNFETSPIWATTPAATHTGLVNAQNHSVYQSAQSYPLDDPLNLNDSKWTTAAKMFWFALA
ncbi:hypothetical protein [Actinopolyspora halophila]|uniref:hypothetical protein n=1 Tax=Actinopolyspora halophila TaxID=1850 RepID=UPI0012FB3B50|nr:hypothetical protein [Actinopolyspora halophila]